MRVVIAGGGTAGHVNPAIALAQAMPDDEVSFVGTETGAEARLVPAAGYDLAFLEVRGFDRARPLSIFRTGWVAARAVARARALLKRLRPDVVVGMGGYVSLPVCIAARRRYPIVVHEQNIVFGLANRIVRRGAAAVAVSFEESLVDAGPRGVHTGNPVSPALVKADLQGERVAAIQRFGLDAARRTILVFGGSQGARTINLAADGLAAALGERSNVQILHIRGPLADPGAAQRRDGPVPYVPVVYVERMVEAYAVADLAVCRGGATTVAELGVCGVPALIVPYPYHRDRQQERHARILERRGAAVVIDDAAATAERLAHEAAGILDDPERLRAMRDAARSFGRPDAADRLAEVVRGCGG